MTISVVASSSNVGGAGTITVTKPTGTANGNTMVAVSSCDNAGLYAALTAPTGWALLGGLDSGSGKSPIKIWTKVAASEGTSYAFGCTNGEDGVTIITTLTGVTTSISNWICSFNFETGTGTTRTAPSITGSGEMLLSYSMISQNGAAATFTTPSGMTECDANNTGFVAAQLAYLVSPSNPTGTKSWVASHAADFGGVSASILLANPSTNTTNFFFGG